MQGRVCLAPAVRVQLRHLVERGHDRVRSQRNPQGTRLYQPSGGLVRTLRSRARLTRGLKTEIDTLNFVRLMARGMT